MSYTRKVAFNTAAQFIGKIVGLAISLLTIAILFRFLGVEGVGKYTTTFSYVAFFTLFADIGLGWTMLRELSVTDDKGKVFRNIFTFRLLLGIVVFTISSLIVWLFKYPVDVKWAVAVLSVAFFFQILVSTGVQIYLNFYRMDIAVLSEVAGKAMILLVIYILSIKGGSLSMVMLAYVLGCALNFFLIWKFASKFVKVGFAFDMKYWKSSFRQALPIGITLVFGFVYYKVDSIMLSLMKDMTDVGIYGTAYKILEVLQMFPALFLGASFSLITKYVTTKDDRVHPAFQKEFDFLALLAVPIVVGTFILAQQIISVVAGQGNFSEASTIYFAGRSITSVTILKILIFSVGVNFITNLYSFMIVSLGKQKEMVLPTIGFAIFNVLVNFYLIPRYSYLGAAIATLLTETLVLAISRYIVCKNIDLKLQLGNFFKILLSGGVMGAVTYILYSLGINLLINLLVSVAVYGLLAILLQAVPKEMVRSLLKLKSN